MKVFITGISGLIGRALCTRFATLGYSLAGLSRQPERALEKISREWPDDLRKNLPTQLQIVSDYSKLEDFLPDVVINLAGEPIADNRWTDRRKQQLLQSRIGVTFDLVEWMSLLPRPPELFVSGSAIGYYGRQGDQWVTEVTTPFEEFTSQLCLDWEKAAKAARSYPSLLDCRVCILRTGVVIAKTGGFMAKLKLPFSLGLGGRLGDGQQYLSWIHLQDMVAGIEHLMNSSAMSGDFNFTAPNPVTNREFTETMSSVLSRPAFFHAPSLLLKLALGELSDILLTGQKVSSEKLVSSGFQFKFANLEDALKDVLAG